MTVSVFMATTSSTAAPTRRAIAGRSSSEAVSQGRSPFEPALHRQLRPGVELVGDRGRRSARLQPQRVSGEVGPLGARGARPWRHAKVGPPGRVGLLPRQSFVLREQLGDHRGELTARAGATLRRMPQELDQLFRLDGRVAIVTGASRGLGERFVRVLRAAGAEVIAAGRDVDALARLAAETGATVEAGDVRDDAHLEELVEIALRRHGRLDIAVPNAGVADVEPFEELDLARLREVVEINLVSVMVLSQFAGRAMLAAGGGSIVTVASILGLVAPGDTEMGGYTAAKAGVIGLTRNLAAEWGRRGVRVNALCPGYFPTPMTGGLEHPGAIKRIERRTLLGRVPRLDELDGALLFLASDASSYMTGQTLVIDGGWTAW